MSTTILPPAPRGFFSRRGNSLRMKGPAAADYIMASYPALV